MKKLILFIIFSFMFGINNAFSSEVRKIEYQKGRVNKLNQQLDASKKNAEEFKFHKKEKFKPLYDQLSIYNDMLNNGTIIKNTQLDNLTRQILELIRKINYHLPKLQDERNLDLFNAIIKDPDMVQVIIDSGANVNSLAPKGDNNQDISPLMYLIDRSYSPEELEALELLLNYGADPYKKVGGKDVFELLDFKIGQAQEDLEYEKTNVPDPYGEAK